MNDLEREQIDANIGKLQAEAAKLYAEAKLLAKQVDREGWRLLFYAIGTGVGVIAALVAAAKIGGTS